MDIRCERALRAEWEGRVEAGEACMRCLMGLIHRERILAALPEGGAMLEWGMGGSTAWFAERLPAGATLTSVEHHKGWSEQVRSAIGERRGVELLLREPDGGVEIKANATAEEDDPTHLGGYIHAVDGRKFDVILVDGYARGTCLLHAQSLLKPGGGGVIYLHDAQRPWYDDAKAGLVGLGHCGSCTDYPVPHLWWGTSREHARAWYEADASRVKGTREEQRGASSPIVVSFYTKGTAYEQEVRGLRESCERLGIAHEITPVNDLGSWERNCAYKARFLSEAFHRLRRPMLWVDADAVLRARPELVERLAGLASSGVLGGTDFAIHRVDGWEFASGTLFFNQTSAAEELLARWTRMCESDPAVWDQVHLASVWEQTVADRPLTTFWLPQSYTKIFDREAESGLAPVVEHYQASRRTTGAVNGARPKPAKPETPAGMRRAIAAARCRAREELMEDAGDAERAELQRRLDAALASVEEMSAELQSVGTGGGAARGAETVALHEKVAELGSKVEKLQAALVRSVARRLSERGLKRVALFGAGRHTRRFLVEPWRGEGVSVVAVLDDRPSATSLEGLPVCRPEEFGLPVEAVVVSSDAHESGMMERMGEVRAVEGSVLSGVPVFTIYSGAELAGEGLHRGAGEVRTVAGRDGRATTALSGATRA